MRGLKVLLATHKHVTERGLIAYQSAPGNIPPKSPIKNLHHNTLANSPNPSQFSPPRKPQRFNSPINRNQNLIPPRHTHSQIRPPPYQPRRPTTNIAHHPLRLHQPLRIPKIRHNSQILIREMSFIQIPLVKPLGEPERLLRGCLSGCGEGGVGDHGVVAWGEDVFHCCAGG